MSDAAPKLVFATGNLHKVREVQSILGKAIEVLIPGDVGLEDLDLPETSDTLEGNAIEKLQALYSMYRGNCLSEDTGLEVSALNGAPGVYSARYAGPECTPSDNMDKLLRSMKDLDDRSARFRTIIALVWDGTTHLFKGVVEGSIAFEQRGNGGFGYDPVFIPEGYDKSFAELSPAVKNQLSHRARATQAMLSYFREKGVITD